MSETLLLFTYGLLRPGQTGHRSLDLAAKTRLAGPDRIHGRLYHLGEYPGLIIGAPGIVLGELLAFDDPALVHELDAYELYDSDQPNASEYRRVEVDLLDSGKRALTYEYNRPVKSRPIIASGEWPGG